MTLLRYKHSEETKRKMSESHKGVKLSLEHVEAIIKAHTGLKYSLPNHRGEKHHRWVGDSVGYRGIHSWIKYSLGRPNKCSKCGVIATGHRMHWANISRKYKRELTDWIRLCSKCHGAYDKGQKQSRKI